MEVNNKKNGKEKSKLTLFLIVWSTFNMIMGVLLFAIPALIYSILFRMGQHESRIEAIVFNALSTIVGLAVWIYIIIVYAKLIESLSVG
jgi:hypothetical protein